MSADRSTITATALPADWGTLSVVHNFPSRAVPSRSVYIWVPPTPGPHDVLLLQDGEKVFRGREERGDSWRVPATMMELHSEDGIKPPLVVGVSATENRAGEYMPEEAVTGPGEDIFREAHVSRVYIPRSRAYRSFLVDELMPYLRSTYDVVNDGPGVTIGGSSRAALFSIYAAVIHPEIFSNVMCMSTHWPHGDGLVVRWLHRHLPPAGSLRVYFDYGDTGLDAAYKPYQEQVDALMVERGYRTKVDWKTLFFPGDGHTEAYWGARLKTPLRFIYGTRKDEEE